MIRKSNFCNFTIAINLSSYYFFRISNVFSIGYVSSEVVLLVLGVVKFTLILGLMGVNGSNSAVAANNACDVCWFETDWDCVTDCIIEDWLVDCDIGFGDVAGVKIPKFTRPGKLIFEAVAVTDVLSVLLSDALTTLSPLLTEFSGTILTNLFVTPTSPGLALIVIKPKLFLSCVLLPLLAPQDVERPGSGEAGDMCTVLLEVLRFGVFKMFPTDAIALFEEFKFWLMQLLLPDVLLQLLPVGDMDPAGWTFMFPVVLWAKTVWLFSPCDVL